MPGGQAASSRRSAEVAARARTSAMSIITPIPPETPWYHRILLQVPVFGWIARDVLFGDRDNVLYFAAIVATVWILAVARWGVLVLLIPFTLAIPAAVIGIFSALVWRDERRRRRQASSSGRKAQPSD